MVNKLILREKHPGNRISIEETALLLEKDFDLILEDIFTWEGWVFQRYIIF